MVRLKPLNMQPSEGVKTNEREPRKLGAKAANESSSDLHLLGSSEKKTKCSIKPIRHPSWRKPAEGISQVYEYKCQDMRDRRIQLLVLLKLAHHRSPPVNDSSTAPYPSPPTLSPCSRSSTTAPALALANARPRSRRRRRNGDARNADESGCFEIYSSRKRWEPRELAKVDKNKFFIHLCS